MQCSQIALVKYIYKAKDKCIWKIVIVTQFSKYFSSICQRFDSSKTSSLRRRNVDEIQFDIKKETKNIWKSKNDIK